MSDIGGNMFGRTFKKLQAARHEMRLTAIADLWNRNKLDNPKLRQGYKIEETQAIHKDGTEVVEYRLYKLVDASRTVVSTVIDQKIEAVSSAGEEPGVEKL